MVGEKKKGIFRSEGAKIIYLILGGIIVGGIFDIIGALVFILLYQHISTRRLRQMQ